MISDNTDWTDKMMVRTISMLAMSWLIFACAGLASEGIMEQAKTTGKLKRSEQQWKQILTLEQYRVLRQKETERAFTGKYWRPMTR